MNLRQLHYFVTVAKELHVARAAYHLGLTQPALSQHIRALEESVGVRLFIRANRRIQLSEAGTAFLAEAQETLRHAEQAVRAAQRAARGESGSISIGYVSSALAETSFLNGLSEFGRNHPDVAIEMHLQKFNENLDDLRAEKNDIAIVRGPLPELPGDYDFFAFSTWEIVVALPITHEQSKQPKVSLPALSRETFLIPEDPAGSGLADTIHRICSAHHFRPGRTMIVNETSSAIGMVAGGLGIALLPKSARTLQLPGMVFRELDGPTHFSELLVLFRRFERSPAIQSLLKQLRQSAPTLHPE